MDINSRKSLSGQLLEHVDIYIFLKNYLITRSLNIAELTELGHHLLQPNESLEILLLAVNNI